MGSVYEEISRLETAKSDIETAIETCGVNVPDTELIDTYASYIRQIPSAVFSELNVDPVGGSDQFIQSIKQTNGLIEATVGGLVSTSNSGLVPKIGTTAAATIATPADEWVLTSTKGAQPTWRKLPANAFKNDDNNTTYTFASGNGGFTVTPSGGTAQTVNIGKPATAGTADKLVCEAATADSFRHVWFSYDGEDGRLVYDNDFTYNPATNVLNVGSITGSANYAISAPAAVNWGGTGSTTKIKVKINSTTSWMLSFVVTLYQGYRATKVMVSGYNYGSNYWHEPKAVLLGDSNRATSINVYFGYDSAWNLWVGFDGGNYTGVSVTDVTNGYTQISTLKDLFTISNVSSLTTVQKTVTATNSVNYANSAGSADSVAWGNITGKPSVAIQKAANDFVHSGNEWTVVPSGFSGNLWLNYRTTGGTNGDITEYKFGNGKGGSLASITNGQFSGNAATATTSSYLSLHDIRGTAHAPNSTNYPVKKMSGWFNNTGTPTNAWHSGFTVKGWTSDYASWQLCSYSGQNTSNNHNLYFRSGINSTWGNWKTILDSSNTYINNGTITINGTSITPITSHQSLANYVTLNTAQTISAKKTFSAGLAITSGATERVDLPYFLGIDAFADGGSVRYLTASKVCAAIGAFPTSGGTITGGLSINPGNVSGSLYVFNANDTYRLTHIWDGNTARLYNVKNDGSAYGTLNLQGTIQINDNTAIHAGNIGSYLPTSLPANGGTATYYTGGPAATFTNVWDCNAPDRIVYSDYGSSGRSVTNAPSGWLYGTMLELGHMNQRGQNAALNMQLMWDVAHGTTNGGTLWFRGKCSTHGWAKNWCKVLSDQNYNAYSPKLDGTGATGTWGINITGNAATVTVGTGTGDTYRAIVVTNGANALYTAGTATGKPRYNYATGDVKAKSFTTDGGNFIGNLTGNASSASCIPSNAINTEASITESDLRAYWGSGSAWTGSVTSMAYAGIITLGSPSRGFQMWARRGTGNTGSLHFRVGNDAANAWETERTILDSANWTSYISIPTVGNGTVTINQGGTSKGSFTLNQSTAATINLTDNNYYPTSFSWTNGTTAGPTGSLTGSGMSAVSFGAIPSASASTSGIVTTASQTFSGEKTFHTIRLRQPSTSGSVNFGGYLYFGDGSYAYIAELSDDELYYHASGGHYFEGLNHNFAPVLVGTIYRKPAATSGLTTSNSIGIDSSSGAAKQISISVSKARAGKYTVTLTNNTPTTVRIHTPVITSSHGDWGGGSCYESPFAYLDYNSTCVFPKALTAGSTLSFSIICGRIHTQGNWSTGDFTKSDDNSGFICSIYASFSGNTASG